MKLVDHTSHVDSHHICVCFKPACAWRAKATSCVQCLAHIWGISHIFGTEMNWYCLQHLLAPFCNQKVSVSTIPSFPSEGTRLVLSILLQVSRKGRGDLCQQGCNYNGFILEVRHGSKEFCALCICVEFIKTCASWTCASSLAVRGR